MSKTLRIHNHIPPEYWGYKGGFAEVVYCTICKTLALREDVHPARPCRKCGNMYREKLKFTAKWTDTTVKFVWWNPYTWWRKRTGYWDLATTSLVDIPDDTNDLKRSLWGGTWNKKF